ncbi:hypothetical protein Ddc_12414 [Ditylenchus destructor]|nr:hypothetical protein Ddc_12414 [Ditylenchus destructor]
MVKTKDIQILINEMAKLDMCPEGESAQTFFGARDPCHFHPPNDTLEDIVRQIIVYYGLQEFIPLPGEGSYFVHFTDECRSPNYANTISTGTPGQGTI